MVRPHRVLTFFTVVLSLALPLVVASREALVSAHPDDAFYYFQIARHVASGDGFTFDGIHTTNGFQPLWLMSLVPIFRAFSSDLAPLRAVAIVEALLAAMAAVWLYGGLRFRFGPAAALAAALSLVAVLRAS
jgi:hypothetical protein